MLKVNLITPDPIKNDNGFVAVVVVVVLIGSQAEQGLTHEREDKDRTLNSEEKTQD